MQNLKKINSIYIKLLFVIFVYILAAFLCSYQHIDSDYSNLVLEANDIINGNIFLKNWTLTGISFITTDLLFFIIGAIFTGISDVSFKIAIAGMVATLICLSFFLASDGLKTGGYTLLSILLLLIPSQMNLTHLRAHTGAVCWCFLAILCVNKLLRKNERYYYGILFVALILGCIGDALSILIGIIPLVLFSLINMLGTPDKKRTESQYVLLIACLALLFSFLIDKLYFLIGSCNKNSFLETKIFEPIENWGYKFSIYIKAILMMQNADFFGKRLLTLETTFYFANTVIIIVGFVIVFKTLFAYVTKKEVDTINVLLSLGFLVISIVFIITDIAIDVWSGRYLGYTPLMLSVLILRTVSTQISDNNYGKQLKLVLLAIAVVSFGGKVYELSQLNRTQPIQKELGTFLQEHGLERGYSTFWNASSTTVLSEGRVQIRAINANSGRVEPHNWFSKKTWYQNYTDFILLDQTIDERSAITEEIVMSRFGNPDHILEYDRFRILVYNKNISEYLYNGLEDMRILPNELYANELTVRTSPDQVELLPGGVLFGPYEYMEAGRYLVSYYGDNLERLTYDVFSNTYKNIAIHEINRANDYIQCEIVIENEIDDIEFREFNKSQENVAIKSIIVQKIV